MELRLMVIGSNGPAQFQLTNAILGREEFPKDVLSKPGSGKSTGELAGRRVSVINGPNIYAKDISEAKGKMELKRSKCLSSPGPHALLVAFDLEKISPNDIQMPKLVTKRFGVNCLRHCMVLLAYEGTLEGGRLDDRLLRTDWHLKELVQKFGGRYHVFNKDWRDRRRDRELLQKVEWMVASCGGSFFSSRTFQTAEASVRKEEKRLKRQRAAEMERACEELGERHSGEELQRQRQARNAAAWAEIRAEAEMDNGWLRTSLARGLGTGLAVGAVMGALVGAVEGPGGMVLYGIIGGAVGGAAGGAAQVAIENLEDRVAPAARLDFNSIFINRFFTSARV
ncbi:unnamed protein product [Merluccius merluccius]